MAAFINNRLGAIIMKVSLIALVVGCAVANSAFVLADAIPTTPPQVVLADAIATTPPHLV